MNHLSRPELDSFKEICSFPIVLQAKFPESRCQQVFMMKVLERAGIQGTCLNIIKAIYNSLIANIKLNGDKLKIFPLKLGIRQGYPLLPCLFTILLEILARLIRQLEEIKKIQIGEVKHDNIYK